MTYTMTIAGLKRELPICKVNDDLYIGAFICFGAAEMKTSQSAPSSIWVFSVPEESKL